MLNTIPHYKCHPVTEEWDDFTTPELDGLRQDLRERGCITPVVLWNGQLVDGRHRQLLCNELGIRFEFKDITELCPDEEQMRGYVHALNSHRRSRTEPLTKEEKRMRVAVELEKDPARSDRKIAAELGMSNRFVSEQRKKLEDSGVSVHTEPHQRVSRKGLKGDGVLGKRRNQYVPIKGLLSYAVKQGVAIERKGGSNVDAVKESGLSSTTYAFGRDVVLLADREDLNARDAATVRRALEKMDKTGHARPAGRAVQAIANRVWGTKGHRFKTEKTRLSTFRSAIIAIATASGSTAEMEIPHLSRDHRTEALENLAEAIEALSALRSRIKEGQ